MQKVIVKAPAKLNLALDVTGTTENGYHTVDMIMQTIGLFETVEITKSQGYSLECPGSFVPTDDKNTATKAASAFFRETGLLAGADIIIHKTVPTRAGMAGGSADAAAVLVGLNTLYNAGLSTQQLCRMGAAIGADVPFSIVGGTVRATGIGEVLTPLASLPACWFCVAMPEGGVSTPAAYSRYDEMGSPVHPSIAQAVAAIENRDLHALSRYMQNALEFSNRTAMTGTIRSIMDESGALASMMTGSGAAVFGLFEQEIQAAQAALLLKTVAQQVFVVQPVEEGPLVVSQS